MSIPERRTIQELVMRYRLEPHLRDVYVEGVFDRDVFTSALSEHAAHDFTFYPIDTVEVAREDLIELSLTDGNKQRVKALASRLSSVSENANYVCLVDRDLDHWFEKPPSVPRLKWTKYCSIESHFIEVKVFAHIAVLTCSAKIPCIETIFESITEVLRFMYSLRLADYELGMGMSWVPLKKYLSSEHSSVSLDRARYVSALLNKNDKASCRDQFLNSADLWLEKFSPEHRLCIRGHDFVELLAWVVSKYGGVSTLGNEDAIQRLFVLAAKNSAEIMQELLDDNQQST